MGDFIKKKQVFGVKKSCKVNFLILLIFAFLVNFADKKVYAKTILSDDFSDYFPPEIFMLFPPSVQAFDTNLLYFNVSLFDFDKSIQENDEVIEIKYVYLPSFLPILENDSKNDEYRYTSNYAMRFFRSEYSTIAIQVDPNGVTTRVYKDESFVRQCKYDEEERLFYEIVWSQKDLNLAKQIFYEFSESEKSVPDYSVEKDFLQNMAFLNFYAENGLYSKSICYELSDKKTNDKKSSDGKQSNQTLGKSDKDTEQQNLLVMPSREDLKGKKIIEVKTWEYDDQNRVIKSIFKKDGRVLQIQKDYQKELVHPDEYIFENSVLKSKKLFDSDTDYSIEIFLEKGFSIKSVYVDNQLERNVFYKDGNFLRENIK